MNTTYLGFADDEQWRRMMAESMGAIDFNKLIDPSVAANLQAAIGNVNLHKHQELAAQTARVMRTFKTAGVIASPPSLGISDAALGGVTEAIQQMMDKLNATSVMGVMAQQTVAEQMESLGLSSFVAQANRAGLAGAASISSVLRDESFAQLTKTLSALSENLRVAGVNQDTDVDIEENDREVEARMEYLLNDYKFRSMIIESIIGGIMTTATALRVNTICRVITDDDVKQLVVNYAGVILVGNLISSSSNYYDLIIPAVQFVVAKSLFFLGPAICPEAYEDPSS